MEPVSPLDLDVQSVQEKIKRLERQIKLNRMFAVEVEAELSRRMEAMVELQKTIIELQDRKMKLVVQQREDMQRLTQWTDDLHLVQEAEWHTPL
jgi:septal ring factor EnvC (AmiA/AmiB activator)